MAFEGEGITCASFKANADLSTKQYYFVTMTTTDGVVAVADNDGDVPIGVLLNTPSTDESARVMLCGVTKVSSNAGLAAGTAIGCSSDGQAEAKVVGTNSDEYVVGQVIQGSSNAGELATAFICCIPNRAS